MYVTKNINYWLFLKSIFNKDEECFENFKIKAKEKGIDICAVHITMVKDSCFAASRGSSHYRVPYLGIIVNGEENFNKVKSEHLNTGLVNHEVAGILRDLWLCVCKEMNLDLEQVYDKKMYVGFERAEEIFYTYFSRAYKPQINTIIENVIGCAPRDLYASSMPGVNIVFETDIYEKYNVESKKKELEEKIRDLAIKTVNAITDGVEITCLLQVICWHPKMPNYSGYGLARED